MGTSSGMYELNHEFTSWLTGTAILFRFLTTRLSVLR